MEKFRKFDDPSCAINPFVIPHHSRPSCIFAFCIAIRNFIVFPPKFLLFSLTFALLGLSKLFLPLLIIRKLHRPLQRLASKIYCTILLALMGVYTTNHKYYHFSHPRYNYRHILNKTAGNDFKDPTLGGDLILATQSTLIDYLVLQKLYSPRFASVDLDTGKLELLSGLRLILFAMGARVTQSVNNSRKLTVKLNKVQALLATHQPLVVFAEGCKTNGLGVLKFHSQMEGALFNLISKQSHPRVHTFRLDYLDRANNPANTTDDCGCESFVRLLTTCYTPIERWHYFGLDSHLKSIDGLNSESCGKQAQLAMVSNYKRYALQIDASYFPQFLKFWKLSQKKQYVR